MHFIRHLDAFKLVFYRDRRTQPVHDAAISRPLPTARANLPRNAVIFLLRDATSVSIVPFLGLSTCRLVSNGQTTAFIRLPFLIIKYFELVGTGNVLLGYTVSMILT
jgi:hypothetical protein